MVLFIFSMTVLQTATAQNKENKHAYHSTITFQFNCQIDIGLQKCHGYCLPYIKIKKFNRCYNIHVFKASIRIHNKHIDLWGFPKLLFLIKNYSPQYHPNI